MITCLNLTKYGWSEEWEQQWSRSGFADEGSVYKEGEPHESGRALSMEAIDRLEVTGQSEESPSGIAEQSEAFDHSGLAGQSGFSWQEGVPRSPATEHRPARVIADHGHLLRLASVEGDCWGRIQGECVMRAWKAAGGLYRLVTGLP